jgi:hypothetical protein
MHGLLDTENQINIAHSRLIIMKFSVLKTVYIECYYPESSTVRFVSITDACDENPQLVLIWSSGNKSSLKSFDGLRKKTYALVNSYPKMVLAN